MNKARRFVVQFLVTALCLATTAILLERRAAAQVLSCGTLSECAYQEVNHRAATNRSSFFVYQDADSAFNHGFASGLFFSRDISPSSVTIDPACLDDVASANGCATDANRFDRTRGTVLRLSFPGLGTHSFVGLNVQNPRDYTPGDGSSGYNLAPATTVQFDIRSPGGAVVQFGVGGCVTGFHVIGSTWQTISIPLNTLYPPPGGSNSPCPPDITNTHILFTVTTNGARQGSPSTVLLDNIQFTPVPARQSAGPGQISLSLPISTLTFGVIPATASPIPTDQANRNVAAIYESALAILVLLKRGQPDDITNALGIADALDYALHHDNHDNLVPRGSDGSAGLHNAYMAGDIGLLNPHRGAHAGDVRLAGFTGGANCGDERFCLVLDGATGGNNAWAIFALAAAYLQSGRAYYLTDAETIGSWIIDRLQDREPQGLSGYFVGFNDFISETRRQEPIRGKSTENNADIFGAFALLAQIAKARGDAAASQRWLDAATAAGNFVKRMEISGGGFYVGTVHKDDKGGQKDRGNCTMMGDPEFGNDVINKCEFIDSATFSILPMAGAAAYSSVGWRAALLHVLNYSVDGETYVQSVTAGGGTYQGFHLVPSPSATGITVEFTAQMAASCFFLNSLNLETTFQACYDTYLSQMRNSQASAPFSNEKGLVASILPNGDTLPVLHQCLDTPFQCIPARVGLASTTWAIIAAQKFNPMAYPGALFNPPSLTFAPQTVGTASPVRTVTLTNAGTEAMTISQVSVAGTNAADFQKTDTCVGAPLAPGAHCTITLRFRPTAPGSRTANLSMVTNAFAGPLPISGLADPVNDFELVVSPLTQSVNTGSSVAYTVQTRVTKGAPQPVTLSVSGLPAAVTALIAPNPISSGDSSLLTISTWLTAVSGSYVFAVTGAGPDVSRSSPAAINIEPAFTASPAALIFSTQDVGTTSDSQSVVVTNPVSQPLSVVILFAGVNSGEFTQTNNCPVQLPALASCTVSVSFAPTGTGPRTALLQLASSVTPRLSIPIRGTGAGTCQTLSACAFPALSQRVSSATGSFFVYKDADSAFNHGTPSGVFTSSGLDTSVVKIDAGCVDLLTSPTGCSADPAAIDVTRGTVLSITFPNLTSPQFAGLNIQEPSNYSAEVSSTGYNLTPATSVRFEARAPRGARVKFGVGDCVTRSFYSLGSIWTRIDIPLNSLIQPFPPKGPCPPDLTNVHLLFAISADSLVGVGFPASASRTILLDNIEFIPVPTRQASAISLPLSTVTYGVPPQPNYPIPTDQVNRNLATTYESALTMLTLFARSQEPDISSAMNVANALHYALHHDNHGDPVPVVNGVTGFHSSYEAGDLTFLNPQAPDIGVGQPDDVRLSGFSASASLCGTSQFCLVLDGASGGNNAWAILALALAFEHTGNADYLADAEAIGDWITTLEDRSVPGFGGYYIGYSDGGLPKQLQLGKSTEQNAVIFAAFNFLSQIETLKGNGALAASWAARAQKAGDFVIQMFNAVSGRFNVGTINNIFTTSAGPGICPSATQIRGPETVNTCDFLTANTAPILAMSGSAAYRNAIDWGLPAQYISTFSQTVDAAGRSYHGFAPIRLPASTGIGWEFTSQAAAVYQMGPVANSSSLVSAYLQEIKAAQNWAPFGDGRGVVGSTLQNGDMVAPPNQCLSTPFQCVPERVGLAATAWAALVDQKANPLSPGVTPVAGLMPIDFAPLGVGSPATAKTLLLTNSWSVPMTLTISITGINAADFYHAGCPPALAARESCTLTVYFRPQGEGRRDAWLSITQTPSWASVPTTVTIPLSGIGGSLRRGGQLTSQ